MRSELPRAVLDAADITAISQLILRERLSRDPDLPGEDRPETVAKLMQEIYDWAGLPLPT